MIASYNNQIVASSGQKWRHHWESVREDVEYTFGILKSFFLNIEVQLKSIHQKRLKLSILTTCCVIYNWLLDYDKWNDWQIKKE